MPHPAETDVPAGALPSAAPRKSVTAWTRRKNKGDGPPFRHVLKPDNAFNTKPMGGSLPFFIITLFKMLKLVNYYFF